MHRAAGSLWVMPNTNASQVLAKLSTAHAHAHHASGYLGEMIADIARGRDLDSLDLEMLMLRCSGVLKLAEDAQALIAQGGEE